MRETFAPVILEHKAARLRKDTGNPNLRSKFADAKNVKEQFKLAIVRPLKLLTTVPIITLTALYVAIEYGILYLLITTFSFVYGGQYGFSEGVIGLTFLPSGIGMMFGVALFGPLTDMLVKRDQAAGVAHRPEVRLSPMLTIPSGLVLPVGLFLYGWTTEKVVHWIVPMIGVAVFSAGLMGVMVSAARDCYTCRTSTLIKDLDVHTKLLAGRLSSICGKRDGCFGSSKITSRRPPPSRRIGNVSNSWPRMG
jgi:hypothetical protein